MEVRPAFVVRRLEPYDRPSVLALAGSLEQWFNAEGLGRMARDLESHRGHVAVRERALLGFVMWAAADEEVAELTWMGVVADLRHRGIGTALLSELVMEVRRAGYRSLVVSTVADSVDYAPYADTRRFYRSRGFADDHVDPLYWGSGDDRYDRLVLRLDLAKAGAPTP